MYDWMKSHWIEKKRDKEPLESCELSNSKHSESRQTLICNGKVAFKWNTETKMFDISAWSVESSVQMSLSIIWIVHKLRYRRHSRCIVQWSADTSAEIIKFLFRWHNFFMQVFCCCFVVVFRSVNTGMRTMRNAFCANSEKSKEKNTHTNWT